MDKKQSTALYFGNPYSPVITQVSLPFSGPIPGGLTSGKQIQIQGIVENKPAASGFSINLCEGPEIEPSCLFHLNPRFYENCIVRNAMSRRGWGREERQGGLPIAKGQLFEVIIMADTTGYFVAVNGRHFTEFKHRAPMANARFLHIKGDFLKINFIQYEGKDIETGPGVAASGQRCGPGFHPAVAPPPYTAAVVPLPGVGDLSENITGPPAAASNNPLTVPLTLAIPGQLVPGRMIHISAVPHRDAKRFTFNLRSGERGNVNFHFDVRLCAVADRKVVVRNTMVNDRWGPEERQADGFPFSPNTPFHLVIMAEASAFKVAVNNVHFTSYAHRQPLAKSDTLTITGDVRITNLRFQ